MAAGPFTVIEVLSPANKYKGADRDQYVSKRLQILASPAHLVEIDLLRGGPRLPAEDMPECDYCVLVRRRERHPDLGVWPIRLREPLPEIPIPLRAPDPDARVALQPLLHRVYDAARYRTYIYHGQPSPRLSAEDAAWAAQILQNLRLAPPG